MNLTNDLNLANNNSATNKSSNLKLMTKGASKLAKIATKKFSQSFPAHQSYSSGTDSNSEYSSMYNSTESSKSNINYSSNESSNYYSSYDSSASTPLSSYNASNISKSAYSNIQQYSNTNSISPNYSNSTETNFLNSIEENDIITGSQSSKAITSNTDKIFKSKNHICKNTTKDQKCFKTIRIGIGCDFCNNTKPVTINLKLHEANHNLSCRINSGLFAIQKSYPVKNCNFYHCNIRNRTYLISKHRCCSYFCNIHSHCKPYKKHHFCNSKAYYI